MIRARPLLLLLLLLVVGHVRYDEILLHFGVV
jgi:hypothetical protein